MDGMGHLELANNIGLLLLGEALQRWLQISTTKSCWCILFLTTHPAPCLMSAWSQQSKSFAKDIDETPDSLVPASPCSMVPLKSLGPKICLVFPFPQIPQLVGPVMACHLFHLRGV